MRYLTLLLIFKVCSMFKELVQLHNATAMTAGVALTSRGKAFVL